MDAGEISPLHEIWDSTTLDMYGEERSMAGTWDYVQWGTLDKAPDFKNAEQDKEPVGRRGQMTGELADLRLEPLERRSVCRGLA